MRKRNYKCYKLSGYSLGIDNMSTSTLKRLIGVIAPQLTDLINFSFVTGTFPNSLKIAKIIPIYKTGPKDALINYRPISILPAISKVFEKTVVSRLKNFFKNQNSLLHSMVFEKVIVLKQHYFVLLNLLILHVTINYILWEFF